MNLNYVNSAIEDANLSAENGDITFTADAGINNGTFTGNNITLTSSEGAIQATVDTGNTANSGLTANAQGEIHLYDDPQIHRVASPEGIYLNGNFQGMLIEEQTHGASEYQTILNSFTDFASEAAIDDQIETIEAAKQADYAQYWQIRHQAGENFDPTTDTFTYSDAQRAELQAQGKTEADITALEQAFTQWVRARHTEFGNPTAYDANYTYQIAQSERNQLEQPLSQTRQTWQAQVNFFGGFQNAQTFFGVIDGHGETSVTTNDFPMNVSSRYENQQKIYQISDVTTNEVVTVRRDALLAILTEEQREALRRAEANGYL